VTVYVYILYAEGDELIAQVLVDPLEQAGYEVAHRGSVAVGESIVSEAQRALAAGNPIVLCATAQAVGMEWTYRFLNAANGAGEARVFVVKMQADVLLAHLTLGERAADYARDPEAAIADLIAALRRRYPLELGTATKTSVELSGGGEPSGFLSEPLEVLDLNLEAISEFRTLVRPELEDVRSPLLTASEFLDRLLLLRCGKPTRAAALLFGSNPQAAAPSAVVQCVEYFGDDKAADRDSIMLLGNVREQVDSAFDFIRKRIRKRERPSVDTPKASVTYAYPMACIREVLVNAVVHRDYADAKRKIHVRLYADRLEVSSPGDWTSSTLGAENTPLSELSGESVS
jgi:TIR domain